jgi:ABC-type Fe3+/spermidine/putrescine transport system ATPase subunit
MAMLSIHNVSKSFGKTQALNNISFEVNSGEIVALLGPSGCGKSTLLSIIAGLVIPDQGEIFWNNKLLSGVPPNQRNFGLMFQDFALFPHMDVYANIAFGLRMARKTPQEIQAEVTEMLDLVGLRGFEKRDVNNLSGGEQQRVALARSLAPRPSLLMLDEPLGSLDRGLRERLLLDLRIILHRMQLTAIYVTHDQEEAFALADRIVVMNAGNIEQIGHPQDIFCSPNSIFVARFLELTNILPGSVHWNGGQCLVDTTICEFPIDHIEEVTVNVLIRPDMARLGNAGPYVLSGKVIDLSFRGSTQRVRIQMNEATLTFEFTSSIALPSIGESIQISLDATQSIIVFPETESLQ